MHPYLIDWPAIGLRVSAARLSMLAALGIVFWLLPRTAHRRAGLDVKRVRWAVAMLGLVALLGARLHFLLAHGLLARDPWLLADLFSGGRHAAGAVLALVAAAPVVCRLLGLPFLALADHGAVALGVALAIQRVGCFLHGCCVGTACTLPFCVRFPVGSPAYHLQRAAGLVSADATSSLPVHPLQLYFAAAAATTALCGRWLERRKAYDGQVLLVSLLLFAASSALLEPLRHDDPTRVYWHGVPQLSVVALAMTAATLVTLAVVEAVRAVRRRSAGYARSGAPAGGARQRGPTPFRGELRIGVPAVALVALAFGVRDGMATLAHNAAVLPGRYGYLYVAVPIVLWLALGCAVAVVCAALRAATGPPLRDERAVRAGYLAAAVFVGALGVVGLWAARVSDVLTQVLPRVPASVQVALALLTVAVALACAVAARAVGGAAHLDCLTACWPRARWLIVGLVVATAPVAWTLAGEVRLELAPPSPEVASTQRATALRTAVTSEARSGPASPQPNVLLLTIDTLRADHVGILGGRAATPSIDRLARDGAVFTRASSAAPWTLPALASVLSGRMPSRHGAGAVVNGRDPLGRAPLDPRVWTLPQAFQAAGYRTQAIVTNPYLSRAFGLDRGFGGYLNLTIASEFLLAGNDTPWLRLASWALPGLGWRDRGDDVSRAATRWLARRADSRPFFLWLHYVDPHPPYGPDTPHKSFRGDSLLATPAEDSAPVLTRSPDVARLRSGEIRLSDAERAAVLRLYRAEVEAVDGAIGHVLDTLRDLGLADDTVVVLLSDHGEEFWEHGGVEHGHTLYDELLHVPLIVRYPHVVPPGLRVAAPVGTLDVAPTLADLAALERPDDLDGVSLARVLEGRTPPERVLVAENLLFAEERVSVQIGDRKYVRWRNGKEELYDLGADPRELRDLSALDGLAAPLRHAVAAHAAGSGSERVATVAADVASAHATDAARALEPQLRALGYVR